MTPAALADLVRSCAEDSLIRRGLDTAALPATIAVRCPREPERGDYVTNVALQVASRVGVEPRELAGWLVPGLLASPALHCAEVAGPGFLNLRLAAPVRAEIIRGVLAAGRRFGTGEELTGRFPRPERWAGAGRVQYAHARFAALDRNAADLGLTSRGAQLELLEHEREREVIPLLGEFPTVVASAARLHEPQRVARHLERLADTHHLFSDTCRVLPMGDEQPGPCHAARLALCQAIRQVLANGLGLFRLSAPERM